MNVADSAEPPNFLKVPPPNVVAVIPIIAVPLSGVSPPPNFVVVNVVTAEPDNRTLPSAM